MKKDPYIDKALAMFILMACLMLAVVVLLVSLKQLFPGHLG